MRIKAKNRTLDLSATQVMGILNVTPDSFSDGGEHYYYNSAINHVSKMVKDGASIIDVGGESTRPGFTPVSVDEELNRVIPIVESISKRFNVFISVDTSKAKVIEEAAKAGMHIINDIRSLYEPNALKIAAKTGLPVCIMHTKKHLKIKKETDNYKNIIIEIKEYIEKEINRYTNAGIKREQLIIDPGFAFGKNLSDNYHILANLKKIQCFNLPILVGISRKSMIGDVLYTIPKKRLAGSLACAVIAAMNGAHIIRAHDVKETVHAMRIVHMTLSKKKENYE
ncbi:Dihydropteroate synthase [Candidatus Providencia siddallii]|uniref:Dihydropteroate synthase n=1 Tax=Candidatus Providencia siddallii TaxID=1715285 RepID=A0A0M6W9K2_9GAMM|nr:Dihydropteroate synthase [Candidatus Providencia siddallii]